MKKIVTLFILLTIISCKKDSKELAVNNLKNDPFRALYGNWVGDFKSAVYDTLANENDDFTFSSKINLLIKKVEDGKVYGNSIIAGKTRPLVGEIKAIKEGYQLSLKEPGDKKEDGRYELTIIKNSSKGKWFVANKKKSFVWERDYKLKKQVFKYNPKAMLSKNGQYVDFFTHKTDSIPPHENKDTEELSYDDLFRTANPIVIAKINASTTLLKEKDLKNLKKLELEIIRNTIYARHGYSFKNKIYHQFFDDVDWYVPVTDNVSGQLTNIEKVNIALLTRFEKYAKDNYEFFGR